MGSSNWSNDFYREREEHRAVTNTPTFDYDAKVRTAPKSEQRTHEKLDPKGVVRESRDSVAHPESLAIGVMCDVTGSMSELPEVIQKKLPALMNLLLKNGYVEHPHILFGAVGDEFSDKGSLQVGQFEAGIEMDDDLTRFWLEGNGGGTNHESYQNAIYFFARRTSIDCFEKRGRKGYLFLIGDELPYDQVSKDSIKKLLGVAPETSISTEDIVAEATERYNIFMIIPAGAQNSSDSAIRRRWEQLLGRDHVIVLGDAEAISETIALAIGLTEGRTDLERARTQMQEEGANARMTRTALQAVQNLAVAKAAVGDVATLRL